MSEVTDWLTAIGTCGAVVTSLWLSLNEARVRRKQEQRSQAEKITAWFVPLPEDDPAQGPKCTYTGLRVNNASDQLIYDFVAEYIAVGRKTAVGRGEQNNIAFGAPIGNVPPGGFTGRINTEGGYIPKRHLIEYAFQDAGGRYWLRHIDGALRRVRKHPLDLYNIPRPVRYQSF
jgi:hypothetical protein